MLRKRVHSNSSPLASPTSSKSPPEDASSPLRSYIIILITVFLAVWFGSYMHYRLPEPVLKEDSEGFSELNARETVTYLAEEIGERIVGTAEEGRAKQYLLSRLREYQLSANTKFDVFVQEESGTHRFDFMHHMVLKMYTNVTNIIVRMSCGEECNKNAVLLNAHYDSMIGSPGAADDGAGIAVMLEIIRVLSRRPSWGGQNAAVFLFNGAEESLQDASHAFVTKYGLAETVRAVVNLEACGTTGSEVLFQANSKQVVEAYRKVPYPHGNVLANDVFRTGIILSDTDFRQFVHYGNLTGLDMALYKNSYLYHTQLDTIAHIAPGTLQHMGENTLALVEQLTATSLTKVEPVSDLVFFDIFGLAFIDYPWSIASRLHLATHLVSLGLFIHIVRRQKLPFLSTFSTYCVAMATFILGAIAAIIVPNLVALAMVQMGKPMTWYSREWYGWVLFAPASALGSIGVQYLADQWGAFGLLSAEHVTLIGVAGVYNLWALLMSAYRIPSAFGPWLVSLLFVLLIGLNEARNGVGSKKWRTRNSIGLWVYVVGFAFISSIGIYYGLMLVDMLVPLMGRVGAHSPADHVIASVFGWLTWVLAPLLPAFSLRHGRNTTRRVLVLLSGWILIAILVFATLRGAPFDALHPRKVYIQHLVNATSGEASLHIARSDAAPFSHDKGDVLDVLKQVSLSEGELREPQAASADWQISFPLSSFIESYRFPLASSNATPPPKIPHLYSFNSSYDATRHVRHLTLVAELGDYTWSVLGFRAHVLDWSIQDELPHVAPDPLAQSKEKPRAALVEAKGNEADGHWYVIRHVAGHGHTNTWRLDLSVRVPDYVPLEERETWKLKLNLSALGDRAGNAVLQRVKRELREDVTAAYIDVVTKEWVI
ncbi:uncharacterized protein VTP21DRAFT_9555 [Calcarisporiella thermophila]|uniref:uncharacterized protein n=1 Tax=Calcarisporiella thermophila TaxID=911321 RepID=UPI003743D158